MPTGASGSSPPGSSAPSKDSGGTSERCAGGRSEWTPPLDDPDQHHDDREHQQDVDEPSYRVRADEPQSPEHDEDDRDGPQHVATVAEPFSRGDRRSLRALQILSSGAPSSKLADRLAGTSRAAASRRRRRPVPPRWDAGSSSPCVRRAGNRRKTKRRSVRREAPCGASRNYPKPNR